MPTEAHPSTVSGVFRKPFGEQVAFWRRKLGNRVPTRRWDDLAPAEHDNAFMVAGAMKADLLTDLAVAVDRAITEGKSLDAFRKDFRAIVERNGWHGWTGEDSKAGQAWRTRTIYRTNASTSYAAGRHAQLVAAGWPLWVYRHGNSREPRLEHLGWNGLVLAPDHAFWVAHYPPSGWGCSCYVVGARSERGARRLGGDPDKKLPAGWNRIDPKTGAPIGISKGWNYAPGASVAPIVASMADKVAGWDYRIAKAFMEAVPEAQRDALARSYRDLPSVADDARRAAQRVWEGRTSAETSRTLGMLSAKQAISIKVERDLDAAGFDFSLSPSEIAHVRASHGSASVEARRGQRAVEPEDFARLPAILNHGSAPRFVGTSERRRQPLFEIEHKIGDETYVTRWEYWRKRRTFTLLSYFIRSTGRA